MSELIKLFTAFFKIGLFTFGGGYAMLPMLEREIVEKQKWTTREDLLDYFAISQCVPGVIAINTATIVGHLKRGRFGALFATIGVITPSVIIITIIAALLSNFMEYPTLVHAFAGIRAAVAALIFAAVINLVKSSVLQIEKGQLKKDSVKAVLLLNAIPFSLFISAFLIVVFGISPLYVILGAAVIGILVYKKAGEVK